MTAHLLLANSFSPIKKFLKKNCNTQILKTLLHFLQFSKLLQQLNENFKAKSRKWQLICYWQSLFLSYQNSKATVLNYRCLWPNYREKGNNNLSRFGHMISQFKKILAEEWCLEYIFVTTTLHLRMK